LPGPGRCALLHGDEVRCGWPRRPGHHLRLHVHQLRLLREGTHRYENDLGLRLPEGDGGVLRRRHHRRDQLHLRRGLHGLQVGLLQYRLPVLRRTSVARRIRDRGLLPVRLGVLRLWRWRLAKAGWVLGWRVRRRARCDLRLRKHWRLLGLRRLLSGGRQLSSSSRRLLRDRLLRLRWRRCRGR
jgi:hypothetical protein